jgi:Ni/Co efflux regulator RcnB
VDRQEARAERVAERPARQARQQARVERRQQAQAPVATQQQVRQEPVRVFERAQAQQAQGAYRDGRREQRQDSRESYRQRVQETREGSRRSAEGVIPSYQRQAARNQQRSEERLREEYRRGDRNDRNWRGDRDGRNWQGDRDGRRSNWDRQWRNDRRYDWQRHRTSNRNIFHGGSYYAPYRNHRYSRLSIGLFLGSSFYSDRYWIGDPWQYRLPAAPYGTQWVRYYDDVLLIDVYSGEVIDVIYDFFW